MLEQCSRMGCDATRRYAALCSTRCRRTCREASASVQPDASALRPCSSAARPPSQSIVLYLTTALKGKVGEGRKCIARMRSNISSMHLCKENCSARVCELHMQPGCYCYKGCSLQGAPFGFGVHAVRLARAGHKLAHRPQRSRRRPARRPRGSRAGLPGAAPPAAPPATACSAPDPAP